LTTNSRPDNELAHFPKKHHLGPQTDSEILGLKKLPKIINYATNKEMEIKNGAGQIRVRGWSPIST